MAQTLGKGSPNPEPQAPPVTPLQTPPFLSSLPAGFFIQPVDILFAAGGSTVTVKTPQTAIAVVAVNMGTFSGTLKFHVIANAQVQDTDGTRVAIVTTFAFPNGSKTAVGLFPLNPERQQFLYSAALSSTDSTVILNGTVFFLCGPTRITLVPPIPFQVEGNPDGSVIIGAKFVSGSNAAQTVDVANNGQADAVEILNAWFVTSGGTATGNEGFWDGTTRVDIDTTAAVASYIFNLGTKGLQNGPPTTQNSPIGTSNVRFVIGAAGIGFTSTLYVVYRVRLIR
jgi:hypothetical protein